MGCGLPGRRSRQPPHRNRQIASITLGSRSTVARFNPVARLGWITWRTLTSVRFAVFQISVLAVAGLIGTLVRQMPTVALRDPAAYAREMAEIERLYESVTIVGANVGPAMIDLFERAGFFRVFNAPWFNFLLGVLVVSIVACTLDRTPRLWRSVHNVTLRQAPAFYDLRLPERARFEHAGGADSDELVRLLRQSHFRVRQSHSPPGRAPGQPAEADAAPVRHVYGDRNQYVKLATLLTHLGLILFLIGGAVTGNFGFETVVFVGEGQTAPVQPVGTPNNMLVKNLRFEAPTRPDGTFSDFRTDLAVYQNGVEIARKTIRVNDPLTVNGFVFHQNTFGPAADVEIRDAAGRLVWEGPVLLDGELAGRPQGFVTIPGSRVGLLLVLHRTEDRTPLLAVTGLGETADPEQSNLLFIRGFRLGASSDPAVTAGYSIAWRGSGSYTGMVIKQDPGQGLIWLAYLSLISGLVLTFYFPRRRVWARLDGDRLELALIAERYVNAEREFERVVAGLETRLGRRALRSRAATRG